MPFTATMGMTKDRIWLRTPLVPKLVEDMKVAVQGSRWSPKNKVWHFPLDMDIARDIIRVMKPYQFNVVLEPDFKQWCRDEKHRYDNLLKPDDFFADQSQWLPKCRAELPHVIEKMQAKPWQIPGAAFMVGQRQVLLADQPGLGKTLMTLAAIFEMNIQGPVLVIAPRTAVNVTWPQQIRQWLGENEEIIVINSGLKPAERVAEVLRAKQIGDSGKRVWVLAGPNYLRIKADIDDKNNYVRDERGRKIIRVVRETVPEFFAINWKATIVDESHQTVAGSSGNKKRWSAQRLGLDALKKETNAPRICISGTPFRGKTENIWGTLNFLDEKKHSSYWNFVKRHYGVTDNHSGFGSTIVKGDAILNKRRFFEELRPIMVRRTKSEVASTLPPKTYGGTRLNASDPNSPVAVWLPLDPKQARQYKRVVDDAMVYLSGNGGLSISVNGALAEMTRLKQIANSCLGEHVRPIWPSNKGDWIENFLLDRKNSGVKTIVASQFTGFLNELSVQLNGKDYDHYLFTGATGDRDRLFIQDQFQTDEGNDIILLNTKAGGSSITLDRADDVIIVDQTWVPDEQEQVEDRAHRPGSDRIHNVTIWNLASLNTIDEDIIIQNEKRADDIMSVIDGERGQTYVKALVQATIDRNSV